MSDLLELIGGYLAFRDRPAFQPQRRTVRLLTHFAGSLPATVTTAAVLPR